jgi:two-component system, LytTR family, response regulator
MAFLPVRMIAAITADGDRTVVRTASGEAWPMSRSVSRWETLLPSRHFARIHRGTIVNLEHVTRVEPWSHYTYQVYVAGVKDPLSMSRRYGASLKHRLGRT